jgi:hypothetical protein
MGLVHQTLAGKKQGLKTIEVWLITLPPPRVRNAR